MGIIKALAKKIILGSSRHLGLYAVASLSVMTVSLSTIAYQGYKDTLVQEERTEANKNGTESRFQQVFYNTAFSQKEAVPAEKLSTESPAIDTAESRDESELDTAVENTSKKKNRESSSEQEVNTEEKEEKKEKEEKEEIEESLAAVAESPKTAEEISLASAESLSAENETITAKKRKPKKQIDNNSTETKAESTEAVENSTPQETPPVEDLNKPTPVADSTSDVQGPPVLPTKPDPFENYYGSSTFNDYNVYLDTALGSMPYYNQHDSHWGSYLYGGTDSISKYGCGPTTAAMIVSAFGNVNGSITPKEMANWSAAYGYFAPKSGSYHEYIPAVLSAFDLIVDTVTAEERTPARLAEILNSGHICVALMGKGALTKGGHFIIITKQNANGTVSIADPNSYPNTQKEWSPEQLLRELKKNYDAGGPLWSVGLAVH